jgi:hypothetical protein
VRRRAHPSASASPVLMVPPPATHCQASLAPLPHRAWALRAARRNPLLLSLPHGEPAPISFPVSLRSTQSPSHHALAEPPHNVVAILTGHLELHHPDQPPKSRRVPSPSGASPSRPFPSFANAAHAKASGEPPHLRTMPEYHLRLSLLFSSLRAESQ